MTIVEAVKEAMRLEQKPLTARRVLQVIIERRLYTFHTDKPLGVVTSAIRRHCAGLDFPSAKREKHFVMSGDGKYHYLHNSSQRQNRESRDAALSRTRSSTSIFQEIRVLCAEHREATRRRIIADLKRLKPETFEMFSKRLLEAYGFHDCNVTQISRDGGIDGHGKLKVGLAELRVAFQCKRWRKLSVGRPEVDRFRGAIQGQCEQGLFFTTSRFAPGAEEASFRPGAVPIVLIDGDAIAELMIEKSFGVQIESLPLYTYALDLVLESGSKETE